MGVVTIKKPLLGELLGLHGEGDEPGGDETALSTLQVRYDQMFREAILHRDNIALLAATELKKLADYNTYWFERAKTLQTEPHRFKPKEVGLPEAILNDVNAWPNMLAERCETFGCLVLVQAPQLTFKVSRGNVTLQAWLRLVLVPSLDPKKED